MHTNIPTSCKCGSGKLPVVRTSHLEFCDTCGESKISNISTGLFISAIFLAIINVCQRFGTSLFQHHQNI